MDRVAVQIYAPGALKEALRAMMTRHIELQLVPSEERVAVLYAGETWREQLAALVGLRDERGQYPVVLVTVGRSVPLLPAVETGIQVFVSLEDPVQELIDGIRSAARREAYCSRSLYPSFFAVLRAMRAVAPAVRRSAGTAELTQRERDVVNLAAMLKSNEEIAHALSVEVTTVKTHVANAYRKLGVRNRAELAWLLAGIAPPTSNGCGS